MTRGRFSESERQYREAIQLDPENCLLRYNLATLLSREGQLLAAQQALDTCLHQNPAWFTGRLGLAYFEVYGNHPKEALADFQRAAKLAPSSAAADPGLAMAYAESGRRGEALSLMRQLEASAQVKGYVRYQLALVAAYLGDRPRLFYWLNQSVDAREQQALCMRIDPVLACCQDDPRMIALERRTMTGAESPSADGSGTVAEANTPEAEVIVTPAGAWKDIPAVSPKSTVPPLATVQRPAEISTTAVGPVSERYPEVVTLFETNS
jgi:tetratricopeptide (TPR) repeat protein